MTFAAIALCYEHPSNSVSDLRPGTPPSGTVIPRILSKQRSEQRPLVESVRGTSGVTARGTGHGVGKIVFNRVLLEVIVVIQLFPHPIEYCRTVSAGREESRTDPGMKFLADSHWRSAYYTGRVLRRWLRRHWYRSGEDWFDPFGHPSGSGPRFGGRLDR